MTENDLIALLRVDPERAAAALSKCKVAGPWRLLPNGRGSAVRDAWSAQCVRPEGLRVAATPADQKSHDEALLADGWILAQNE